MTDATDVLVSIDVEKVRYSIRASSLSTGTVDCSDRAERQVRLTHP